MDNQMPASKLPLITEGDLLGHREMQGIRFNEGNQLPTHSLWRESDWLPPFAVPLGWRRYP